MVKMPLQRIQLITLLLDLQVAKLKLILTSRKLQKQCIFKA